METESDNIVAETAARIFADLADPQTINRASDASWKQTLWRALSDAGLTLAWVPEKHGGAGASLADGFAIPRGTARKRTAVRTAPRAKKAAPPTDGAKKKAARPRAKKA